MNTPRPRFGQIGSFVDDEYLRGFTIPDEVEERAGMNAYEALRVDLSPEIKASADKGAEFLRATSLMAQMVAEDDGEHTMTAAEVRDGLQQLAQAVATMQTALHAVSGDSPVFARLESYLDLLRLGSPQEVEVRPGTPAAGRLLRRLWGDLDALGTSARFAASKVIIDQGRKPDAERARFFVRLVADRHRAMYGKLPPYSKLSWFAPYMRVAGAAIGVKCTASVVEQAITEMRDSE